MRLLRALKLICAARVRGRSDRVKAQLSPALPSLLPRSEDRHRGSDRGIDLELHNQFRNR